ncbi:MAG TPA: phosphocholine cytidylyltransferase family protein [Polyangia bacterium]|nr:phosphocholine cytidylyltransferase family protein [Polyangia bacterium]
MSKAIIVAAGRGRRLGPETDAIPKCMVRVGGRPILHRQVEALQAAGADELVIVRGYLGDRIATPARPPALPTRFVENPAWAENNILASLMYAAHEQAGGFLFSYSDIVFAREHARRAAEATGAVALVIDRRWRDAYEGRALHPVSEAELARVEDTAAGPHVTRVGKKLVAAEDAVGEFIGLARFSPEGAAALADVWREALARGLETPFGAAATLRNAYLSDALNALAERGVPLVPVFVDGRWREIDTEEDLARAHALVDSWD